MATTSAASDMGGDTRETTLSDADFDAVRKLIRDVTGINMGEQKRTLVERRLSDRLAATGIRTYKEYIEHVRAGESAEVQKFCNAVSTNLTSFFREKHHFEYLADTILPELVDKKRRGDKRIRIWSAGCSTGEEPYSIAMTLQESLREARSWDVKVLCTDLDTDVLAKAKSGEYRAGRVDGIDEQLLRKWFLRRNDPTEALYKAKPVLQERLVFRQLNLMEPWPMKGRFDVIFCRNVVIYFDKETQRKLVSRYREALADDGYLILGHSETLFRVSEDFELVGNTIYRKIR